MGAEGNGIQTNEHTLRVTKDKQKTVVVPDTEGWCGTLGGRGHEILQVHEEWIVFSFCDVRDIPRGSILVFSFLSYPFSCSWCCPLPTQWSSSLCHVCFPPLQVLCSSVELCCLSCASLAVLCWRQAQWQWPFINILHDSTYYARMHYLIYLRPQAGVIISRFYLLMLCYLLYHCFI